MWANKFNKFVLPVMLAASVAACAAIEGRETPGQYVDDTAISTKVKAQFVRDPVVKASQVNVETMQGVVQLSGFVDTPQEAERAAQLARNVEGVRGVRNDIIVRRTS
jgi:osmotically-inducible protein OsmY